MGNPGCIGMKNLDLFSGIGGFSLGLERCGMQTVAFCEVDKFCRQLLMYRWPDIPIYRDVRNLLYDLPVGTKFDLICGGDPCQSRSVAKGNLQSKHPDLSGYFLSVVGNLRPRWVVRENVPAADVKFFAAALEVLGYGIVIIELNAKDFTAQSRRRQFVIGGYGKNTTNLGEALFKQESHAKDNGKSTSAKAQISACLTSHTKRYQVEDTYCVEPGHGIRILTAEERERLQGFPAGWTKGFSWWRRGVMIGNAVPPPMVEFIGRAIMEAIK